MTADFDQPDFADIDFDLGVDPDDIEEPTRRMAIPAGTYRLKVLGFKDAGISQAGNRKIQAHFSVLTPPTDPAPDGFEYYDSIREQFVQTPNSAWKFAAFAKACGIPLQGRQFTTRPYIGAEFVADVGIRTFTRQDGSAGFSNEVSRFHTGD